MLIDESLLINFNQNKDDDNLKSVFEQMYYVYHVAFCEGKISKEQALTHFKEIIEQNEHLI